MEGKPVTVLNIPDDLVKRLQTIAQNENRPVDAVLSDLIDLYTARDPLMMMDGMFDDDLTDLSTTVRETMETFYKNKYGRSD
jgi:hypothetical protein